MLYAISYHRDGTDHQHLMSPAAARALADYLLRVFRITATVERVS